MRRAHFSIEWMAQSSSQHQAQAGPDGEGRLLPAAANNQAFTAGLKASGTHPASLPFTAGLKASGTHPASLPGSYCRQQSHSQGQQQDSHSRKTSPPQHHVVHHDLHSQMASETGFSSGTEEEETSGYESEVSGRCSSSPTAFNNNADLGSPLSSSGRSLSPTAFNNNADPGSPVSPSSSSPLGRRPRTAFTAEQISSLERAFKRNAYLGTQDKAELCSKLSLSDKQVRNWFQNRRMKLKRTVQDAYAHACQANMASQLLHYPELQAAAAAAYHQQQQQQRPGPYTPRFHPQGAVPYHTSHSTGSASPPALTLDSFYHYAAGLPGAVLLTSQRMGSYQPLPQQY